MNKYKAGDTLITKTILDDNLAEELNSGFYAEITNYKIISHEPAPEPIVTYGFVLDNGSIIARYDRLDWAKTEARGYIGVVGFIKTTTTNNDFTVEKVTE